jgi:hypothetical protein
MWMAPLSGPRRIAGVATMIAAAFAAGPVLGAPAAYAKDGGAGASQETDGDARTVKFTGGSLLNVLLCRTEPSRNRLTVPVNSRVVFVNRIGQPATLHVNGRALVQLAPDQAAPLVFRQGPVSVSMTFPCGAGVMEQFSSMSVTVVTADRPEAGVSPPAHPQPATSAATGVSRGVPVMARPSGSDRAALVPAQPRASASAAAAAAPATDRPAAATATVAPGASAGSGGDAVAVGPLVRVSGTPRDNPSGPLALLGAVCAVAVTIAVIRSIITKRTISTHNA